MGLVQVDGYSEFVDRFLTAAPSTALNDLDNGPLPGLKGYFKKLEKDRFAESFGQLRRAVGEHRLRNVPLTVITQSLGFELPRGLPGGLTSAVFNSAWTTRRTCSSASSPAPDTSSRGAAGTTSCTASLA